LNEPHLLQGVKVVTHLKDFALRRESWGVLLTQGHLGKCFLAFSHPNTQTPWSKEPQPLLKLMAASVGCCFWRCIECKSYGVMRFPPRFKKEGKGSQAMCASVRIHVSRPCCKAVRMKPKHNGDPQKLQMPGVWNVCWGNLQAVSRDSPGERRCLLQPVRQPIGTYIMTACTIDAGHWATGFTVFRDRFWSCFSLIQYKVN
jgi:hypothetical protein